MGELARSARLLDDVQRLSSMGFWEFDVTTGVVTWSDELFRIYGLHPQEFEASYEAFLARIHPADRDMVNTTVQQAMSSHESWAFDHRIIQPGGAIRWLHGRGHVALDGNTVTRLVGTATDITDRKQTEQRLRRFVADASHELRTPVASLLHAAEALQSPAAGPGEKAAFVDIIVRQTHRLNALTHSLLDLETMDLGPSSILLRATDLGPLAAEVASSISEHGQINLRIPPETMVEADRDVLHTILQSLVTNALRHGAPPVNLTAIGDDAEVLLVVEDAGPGLTEEQTASLFTPLTPGQAGGSGSIRIASAKSLARAMGGTLSHAPTPETPGRFVVRLKAVR